MSIEQKPHNFIIWKSICGVLQIFKSGLELSLNNEWIWKFNDLGEYSVASDYEVARNCKLSQRVDYGETFDLTSVDLIWKQIWRMRVSERVKLVTWRLFHDSLPLFLDLRKHDCYSDQDCGFCVFKGDGANHLFIDRWWTKCLWASLGMEDKLWYITHNWHISDWVWHILTVEDLQTICLVLKGIWTIWYNRNLAIHEKSPLLYLPVDLWFYAKLISLTFEI